MPTFGASREPGRFRRMGSKAGQYNIPDSGKAIWDYVRDEVARHNEELLRASGEKSYSKWTTSETIRKQNAAVASNRVSGGRLKNQPPPQTGGLTNPAPLPPLRAERFSRARGSLTGGVDVLNHNKSQAQGWVSRLVAPRHALREGAASSDRIGGGKIGSQGLKTLLSNYGAQKDFSDSLAGASASRLKAVKNLVNRPGTWMNRFAVIWVASEAAKVMKEWRGWDKVSWHMSDGEATKKLRDHKAPNWMNLVSGTAMSGALQILNPFTDLALGLIAGTGLISEADAARASDYVSAMIAWSGSGFRGRSPTAIVDRITETIGATSDRLKFEAEWKAEKRYFQMIDDNIDRMRDTLALRGVGNRLNLRSAYAQANRPLLDQMKMRARLGVDDAELLKDELNRELAKNRR